MTSSYFSIKRATPSSAEEVAIMVGELLDEIMSTIGIKVFHFDYSATVERLISYIEQEKYFVFVAYGKDEKPYGFMSMYESYGLYAGGTFGTIPEFFIRPEYRSHAVGKSLIKAGKVWAEEKGWKRIEVTTPPLPEFERTLSFYEKNGFSITGSRKLKLDL